MGYTALVRWHNAPTTTLDLIKQNIIRNHGGIERAKWSLGVRSLRTVVGSTQGLQMERTMSILTMNNNAFVYLDDNAAPDYHYYLENREQLKNQIQEEPSHYRMTFVATSPPGALESLLTQLGSRWVPTRQPSTNTRASSASPGNHLSIEGSIFSIGTDWLVRAGNVILTGGTVKGMLLEVEYLPLPKMYSEPGSTPALLSNMLISILPKITELSAIVAITVSDQQWEEIEWNCNQAEQKEADPKGENDGVYVYEDTDDASLRQKGDWTGIFRDRRSAYAIMGSLKGEGLL